MLEIFIPTLIKKQKIQINKISENFSKILEKTFGEFEIKKFDSTFFEGIKISGKKIDKDLIILCNGEFGENYFLDYDTFSPLLSKEGLGEVGVKIIGQNKIGEEIQKIMLNITEITGILTSDKLLTNSKKEEILEKIKHSFFALSGVIFLLYSLKEKADKNLEELNNYSGKIEYEAQASLLKETSLTKSIELKANIDKLENKIDMFIGVIGKIIN